MQGEEEMISRDAKPEIEDRWSEGVILWLFKN